MYLSLSLYIYIYVYLYVYVYIYICICVYIYIYIYTHPRRKGTPLCAVFVDDVPDVVAPPPTLRYVCIVCVYIYIYVYAIYIYIYTHVYTYTYIYIYNLNRVSVGYDGIARRGSSKHPPGARQRRRPRAAPRDHRDDEGTLDFIMGYISIAPFPFSLFLGADSGRPFFMQSADYRHCSCNCTIMDSCANLFY